MNRQSVTLRAHDSINLTTGVVTRSNRVQSQSANLPFTSLGHGHLLERNDLTGLALWFMIHSDH